MSTSIIGILILCGVGCLAFFAYIAQSMENARQERRRRILALQDRTRHCWNLVTEIPPTYLPENIRLFLLNYLSSRYNEILSIDPQDNNAKNQLTSISKLKEQPYKSTLDTPEPIFNDLVTAKNTAAMVKNMVNFFVGIHKDGSLEKSSALKFINQGKALFSIINTDISQLNARLVEQGENPRLALSHYNNCRKQLESFAKKGQMPERINFIDKRINVLRSKVAAEEQKLQLQQQEDATQQKQDEEWNEFDEDGNWKRKQDYE
ncbi:hypothetical protein [Motiliproteus sp. MSK22-1]|uniref:hypothetical protein n=1 Tax=Motiliproteus sp. MSK22-1 TaxID=1897630 RepID=UPI000976ACAC|nr:hypothetical protein [Motiliproteus sp. MSK22-1]OMH38164.1 hypothetical protein BGP75_07815 [Motiliproteus sp. MSK22-1]